MRNILCISLLIQLASPGLLSQHVSYMPGEKLKYSINYGVLSGGEATLELKRDTFSGKEVWHSRLEAKTTGLADALYHVLDIYESYMDPATGLPVKSIRNIREGKYKKYNVVLFDHKSRSDSAVLTSDLTGLHVTQPGIHDIISCFYFFRNEILPYKTLVKGEVLTIMTWFTDELYPIRLKFVGTDEIKWRHGRLKCYKFNPVTEKGRLFSTEEGISFWFTADKNFLPVKIRFDIFVGSFTVEMTEYEGLLYPLELKNR